MNDKKTDISETGKRIYIELGTQLQIEIEGIAFRFKSELIGMESGGYLILKIPLIPDEAPVGNIKHKLFPGMQIVVRYLHKGTVFGFRSQLIDAIFSPQRLLFLKYPQIVERYDLRSDKRVDCILPAILILDDLEIGGTILDINKKGCRYLSKEVRDLKSLSAQIDEDATLRCLFPGIEGERIISGNVKNIQQDRQGVSLGIQFREMPADIKDIIARYISTIKEFS